MRGDQGPSGRRPPEDPNLLPPINDALLDRWLCQDSGPQPLIAGTPDGAFFPGLSNRCPRLDPSSHPLIADAPASSSWGPLGQWPPEDPSLQPPISSSSSCPLGHWPPQDPSRQPQIAAAPTKLIVLRRQDVLALDSLSKGSRSPIIIAPQFPLKHLPGLNSRILQEQTLPPVLRAFELDNPDILNQLRIKFYLLSRWEAGLADCEGGCRSAITKLGDAKSMFLSIWSGMILPHERISIQRIHHQIDSLNAIVKEISPERNAMRQILGL